MLIEEYTKSGAPAEKCSFCNEQAPTGMWLGGQAIFCCKHCAIEILPQLMADAIVGGTTSKALKDSTQLPIEITKENKLLQHYHGAFSTALIRKLRHPNNA